MAVEPLLLTTTAISTFVDNALLTRASGFFFNNEGRLFLCTSRHVLTDPAVNHRPNRIEIELHSDADNAAKSVSFSIPLFCQQKPLWRQGQDSGGDVDVAVIEIDSEALPAHAVYRAFSPRHLEYAHDAVAIGTPMLVVGFPLGFHDTLHHLPVVRHAINASPFALRFQGNGYFLTDARTHRGTSGAAVVMRNPSRGDELPWDLMGIHSARLDMGTRDNRMDEALGLNCAWFADILLTLTE